MKILKETDLKADEIIEKVGGSWNSRISSTILLKIIEVFSSEGMKFKTDLIEYRSKKQIKLWMLFLKRRNKKWSNILLICEMILHF